MSSVLTRPRPVRRSRLKRTGGLTAAAVAAAGAAGVLAAPPAAASDPWGAVRQCESGGDYSINTGSGFYGAYQMTADAWHSVGFSGLPSDASPATQDEAARRLYARYGTAPWPVCGQRYGGASSSGTSSGATSSGGYSAAAVTSNRTSADGSTLPSWRIPAGSAHSACPARTEMRRHPCRDPAKA
jgi:hypothetical protein